MADQDFNIKVVTTADTKGLRQVGEQMDAIRKRQAEAEAKWAKSPINPRNQVAAGGGGIAALGGGPTPPTGSGTSGGLTGTAVGLGTIVTLLTTGLNKWKEFNAEQDRLVDGMIKAEGELRKLGEAIVEMQDKAISARRDSTEPLEQSFIRLQQEIIKLKAEQSLLSLPTQGKEWDDLQKKINETQSALEKVRQEAEKAGKTTAEPTLPFPKAGKGESQSIVDEIERNRRAAEDALKNDVYEYDPETGGYKPSGKKQFPVFQSPPTPPTPPISNPAPNEDMIADKVGGLSASKILQDVLAELKIIKDIWR